MRGRFARDIGVAGKKTMRARSGLARAARPAVMEMLEGRELLATYYVSPYGSDSRTGTSTGSAWKSINRVNQQTLRAGDQVLFEGGKSFSGALIVNSNEGGTASTQVVVGTYG